MLLRTTAGMLSLSMTLIAHGQVGTIDPTFNPTDQGNAFGDGANSFIQCVAAQADGKMIIGGAFNAYNGLLQNAWYLARVDIAGALDNTFDTRITGANNHVVAVAVQTDGKILAGGDFTTYKGVAVGRMVRVNSDASIDPGFNTGTGAIGRVSCIVVQGNGSIIVAGAFTSFNGTTRGRIARLTSTGVLDAAFATGAGANGDINSIALQTDGKVVIGGTFTTYDGVVRNRIARLNSDGSLDASFDPGTGANQAVHAVLVQPDGAILVGGAFTTMNGAARNRQVRLTNTGVIDATFNIGTGCSSTVNALAWTAAGKILVGGALSSYNGNASPRIVRIEQSGAFDPSFAVGSGPDQSVLSIAQRTDGRVIIGGQMYAVNGTYRRSLARLATTGAHDLSFNMGTGANHWVNTVSLQPDGRMFIGGLFTLFNGSSRKYMTRLLANGSIDPAFNATAGTNDRVNFSHLQADGRIVIAGEFTQCNSIIRNKLARLNADGTLDATFDPGSGPTAPVGGIHFAVLPDGRIIVAGSFTLFKGVAAARVVRLLPNGDVDPSFSVGTGPNGTVHRVRLQADGRIVIAGSFTMVNGTTRNRIARLNADGSLDNTFDPGTGPDVDLADLRVLPDGKMLVAGNFTSYGGTLVNSVARLNANGTLDGTFVTDQSPNGSVDLVLPLPDGRIMLAGDLSFTGDGNLYKMARLQATGVTDVIFPEGTGSIGMTLADMVCQPDGKLIIAGFFVNYAGTGRNRITRLFNANALTLYTAPRVLLEGPYDSGTQWMNDALRANGSVPLTEPYSALGYTFAGGGGETTTPAMLSTTGQNAVVDWVLVELRDQYDHVWRSKCGLLQRDGDVIDAGGLGFRFNNTIAGNYHLMVRHRNHLGVMTASPVLIEGTGGMIDLSDPATATYGSSAQKQVGTRMVLWAGDATGDGTLKYTGSGNDRDPILTAIGGSTPNAVVNNVYDRRDTNLDGTIKYTGAGNDRDIILTNVGSTTPNTTRMQQLP